MKCLRSKKEKKALLFSSAQGTKRAKKQAHWRGRRSRHRRFLLWQASAPLSDSEVPTLPAHLRVSANPSTGGEAPSSTAPLFPILHKPPTPNRSTPQPRGTFPTRSPVRVVIPAVAPVVLILFGLPPFMAQFAWKSLVKWTKGAVGTHVLLRLCPLRPTFSNTRGR